MFEGPKGNRKEEKGKRKKERGEMEGEHARSTRIVKMTPGAERAEKEFFIDKLLVRYPPHHLDA